MAHIQIWVRKGDWQLVYGNSNYDKSVGFDLIFQGNLHEIVDFGLVVHCTHFWYFGAASAVPTKSVAPRSESDRRWSRSAGLSGVSRMGDGNMKNLSRNLHERLAFPENRVASFLRQSFLWGKVSHDLVKKSQVSDSWDPTQVPLGALRMSPSRRKPVGFQTSSILPILSAEF